MSGKKRVIVNPVRPGPSSWEAGFHRALYVSPALTAEEQCEARLAVAVGPTRPPTPEEALSRIGCALDRLCGQFVAENQHSHWHVKRVCDDLARDYGDLAEVRRAFADHPHLGQALLARAKGMRWDAIAGEYAYPEVESADLPSEKLRDRGRLVGVKNYDGDMRSASANNRERFKGQSHGKRHRGKPVRPGLLDLAGSTPRRSRLIPAKPAETAATLVEAMAKLPERQRIVFQARVIAEPPRSLLDIAGELRISKPRVNALEKKARENVKRLLAG